VPDVVVMRAACLSGPRDVSVSEVAEPTPAPDEVLVRIRACGLCASDLNAWRGVPGIEYPLAPGAPGHEVWGEIIELGAAVPRRPRESVSEPSRPGESVSGLKVGDLVSGLLWNGLAEFGVARAEDLIVVPGPILGEPLACAANVVRRAAVQPGDRVAIVGFGYLAALVAQLLPDATDWMAVSRRDDSRALALRLGASAAFSFEDVPADAWDSYAIVIESAGVQQTLDHATWLVAFGGRLVIAGYHADGPRTVNMQSWNWKGIDVINAHERDPAAYARGLQDGLALTAERRLDLGHLITHTFPLERAADAFALLEARPPGFVKAVIQP